MTERPRILVVDDEDQLLALTSYALETSGFEVSTASTGAAALAHTAHNPVDMIVLDVLLPDGNGLDLCSRLKYHTDAPVLFLTVMSDQADIIAGLEAGGDDYLAKPFSVEELILRINAVLRRSGFHQDKLEIGNLRLHLESHEAAIDGKRLELTPLEFRFLRYLASNRNRVVSATELVQEVWQVQDLGAHDPVVKTVVYRIRRKLSSSGPASVEIRNLRGVGYQLRTGEDGALRG